MSDVSKAPQEDPLNSTQKEQYPDLQVLEIDLVEKVKELWDAKKTILIITACFAAFGLFHYMTAPDDYESSSTLIQEVESSGASDGGSALLRSITGINLPSGAGGGNLSAAARGRAPLPVNLYPLIVNSTDFQKDLIYREIEFSTLDTTMTLYDYFTHHYQPPVRERVYSHVQDLTIYLPFTVFDYVRGSLRNVRSAFASSSTSGSDGQIIREDTPVEEIELIEVDDRLLTITPRERSIIERMRLRIEISIGGGVTEILTRLPDPKAAALVNALVVERIQEYMTEYRIEKARQNFENVTLQYEEARTRYEEAQLELAEYQDANINVRSNVVRTQEEYLRDQRNLRFNVYNSLAQEVEQARLVMQQEIPVFNILEKPNVPTSSYTGSSDLVLVFSIVLGFFSGAFWVLIRNFFRKG
jgi:hypothetical protein